MRLCTTSATKSSANGAIVASPTAALLFLSTPHCAVCPANSSSMDFFRASLVAASFNFRDICHATFLFDNMVGASHVAALFRLRAISSVLGMLRATIVTA